MDTSRLDRLTRSVSILLSRRTLVGTLGLAALARPFGIEAKKRKKKKKIRRNSFGCVNVGGYCKNSGQCCSGICEGKKGKKKCQAHGTTGGCQSGHSIADCGGASVTCPDFGDGQCATTTGNAAFCFEFKFQSVPPCRRDADCRPDFFPGVACLRCGDGTTCAIPPSP
jgi:hypothetical protein